jgi:ABC-type uncharacterized transport system ATPase subunit
MHQSSRSIARKTYGKTLAVDDLSLEVSEGEIFGMVNRMVQENDHHRVHGG